MRTHFFEFACQTSHYPTCNPDRFVPTFLAYGSPPAALHLEPCRSRSHDNTLALGLGLPAAKLVPELGQV